MVFLFGLRQTHLFGSYFISTLFITINGVISICFDSYINTIKKVTRITVRITKSTMKSIFMVFSFGLRETGLFWIFFTSTLFITINGVIKIGLESYLITIKKVSRRKLRISKYTIKSIFMVLPSGSRERRKQIIFWNLFYFINVKYHQWCHLKKL